MGRPKVWLSPDLRTAYIFVNGGRSLDECDFSFVGRGMWVLVVGWGGVGDGLAVVNFRFSGIYLR